MQSSTNTIRRAARFDFGEAATSNGTWFSRDLFCIEGEVGVWRRVPRSTSSLKMKREGAIVAEFNQQLIELIRYTELEDELIQAGFVLNPLGPPTNQIQDGPPLTTLLKKSIEQVQQKQKAGV